VFYKVRHRDESLPRPFRLITLHTHSKAPAEPLTVAHLKRAIRRQENWLGGEAAVQMQELIVEKLSEEEITTAALHNSELLSAALRGTNEHNFLWVSVDRTAPAGGAAPNASSAAAGPSFSVFTPLSTHSGSGSGSAAAANSTAAAAANAAAGGSNSLLSDSVLRVVNQAAKLKAREKQAAKERERERERQTVGVELQTLLTLWRHFKNLMASHSIKITMFALFWVAIARPNPVRPTSSSISPSSLPPSALLI
jgi:hypothetical protein